MKKYTYKIKVWRGASGNLWYSLYKKRFGFYFLYSGPFMTLENTFSSREEAMRFILELEKNKTVYGTK